MPDLTLQPRLTQLSTLLQSLRLPSEKAAVESSIKWIKQARPNQLAPAGDWGIWLILAGRGWGKTRTGAQDIVHFCLQNPGVICAVVAPTHGDLRRVCFDGPSGIMSLVPEDCLKGGKRKGGYNMSASEIYFANGSLIQGHAAIEPDRMRGPQYHRAWCDELAAWRYPEAFDQLMFGLRLGKNPQCLITTTPKPKHLIRKLAERGDDPNDPAVVVTKGSTFENRDNLAPGFFDHIIDKYEGTSMGRQELYADILAEAEGALWQRELFHYDKAVPEMRRVVVAIDPAASSTESADETGIIVAGIDENYRGWVLADNSGRYTPRGWAARAIQLYREFKADRIVAEVNNGGEMVEMTLRTVDPSIAYKAVHASRGKAARAEPIAAKYEQGLVTHKNLFPELEDQLCSWEPLGKDRSPDRLDALVWALTELMLTGTGIDVNNIEFIGELQSANPGWDMR